MKKVSTFLVFVLLARGVAACATVRRRTEFRNPALPHQTRLAWRGDKAGSPCISQPHDAGFVSCRYEELARAAFHWELPLSQTGVRSSGNGKMATIEGIRPFLSMQAA